MKKSSRTADNGFTLVEMLVAIVVLGILSAVTVFAVRGITDRGNSSACATELRNLRQAGEVYFARYTNTGNQIATQAYPANTGFAGNAAQSAIPAPAGVTAGATPGATLVNAGILRAESSLLWVAPSGAVLVRNATCGTVGSPMAGATAAAGGGGGGGSPTTVPSFSGVLDGLSVQPVAAYSLRRLSSAYTGPAVQVRRSSDNTTQNIGFLADGSLDTAALTAFVGSGSGFVTTMYDQSGNSRNAVQASTANQPIIVNAGALVTIGGKPALNLALNRGVLSPAASSFTTGRAITVLVSATSTTQGYHGVVSHDGGRSGSLFEQSNTIMHSNVFPAGMRKNGTILAGSGSLAPITTPFVLDLTLANPTAARTRIGFGNYDATSIGGAMVQGDLIVFPTTVPEGDRVAVTQSIGGFYGIATV